MLAQFVRDHQREVLGEIGSAYANNPLVMQADEYCQGHGLSLPLVINDELKVRTPTHKLHTNAWHTHTPIRTRVHFRWY